MAPGDRRCDVSPFCERAEPLLAQLGRAAELEWRWVHLGPIGPHTIPLVEHQGERWRREGAVSSEGPIGRFGGYHLDLLGLLTRPPGIGALHHELAGLWYVYGVAWRSAADPRVEWQATPDGAGELRMLHGSDGMRPDAWAIAGRCGDLLSGRLTRRGHPITDAETAWRNYALAVKADEMKAANPSLPYSVIAATLGVSERALRNYRAIAARWHGASDVRRLA